MTARPTLAAWLLALLAAGCTTATYDQVPAPYPEVLEWAAEGRSGAFAGLKTEENDSGSLEDLFFAPGVRVTRVVENSPAQAAGLRPGDVVLRVDDQEIDDPGALQALIDRAEPGQTLALEVRRGDTVFGVDLTLAGASDGGDEAEVLYLADPARSGAGWATAPRGVLLAAAAPGSPFAKAGVPLGSVVVAVDGEPALSARGLIREFQAREPGTTVEVEYLLPDGGRRYEPVRLLRAPKRVTGWNVLFLASYQSDLEGRKTETSILDLYIFELYQFRRDGPERHMVLFELFGFDLLSFSWGVGELE